MSVPHQSFGMLSTRLIHSSSTSPIGQCGWCPLQDLLCVATCDSSVLQIQRLMGAQQIINLNYNQIKNNIEEIIKQMKINSIHYDANEIRFFEQQIPSIFSHSSSANSNSNSNSNIISTRRLISHVVWRPDGKSLVVIYRNGLNVCISIENKSIIHIWTNQTKNNNRNNENSNNLTPSISTVKWINIDVPMSLYPLQQLYLNNLLQLASSSSTLTSTDSSSVSFQFTLPTNPLRPLHDDTYTYFSSVIPTLDSEILLEQWMELATTNGANLQHNNKQKDNQNTHQHRMHIGAGASASSISTTPVIRTILHDSCEQAHLNILFEGDTSGKLIGRLFGCLDLFEIQCRNEVGENRDGESAQQLAIIGSDICSTSGLISIATTPITPSSSSLSSSPTSSSSSSSSSSSVSLHFYALPLLITHRSELCSFTHQIQQIQLLNEYVSKAMDNIKAKWKTARKSFDNKVKHTNKNKRAKNINN